MAPGRPQHTPAYARSSESRTWPLSAVRRFASSRPSNTGDKLRSGARVHAVNRRGHEAAPPYEPSLPTVIGCRRKLRQLHPLVRWRATPPRRWTAQLRSAVRLPDPNAAALVPGITAARDALAQRFARSGTATTAKEKKEHTGRSGFAAARMVEQPDSHATTHLETTGRSGPARTTWRQDAATYRRVCAQLRKPYVAVDCRSAVRVLTSIEHRG